MLCDKHTQSSMVLLWSLMRGVEAEVRLVFGLFCDGFVVTLRRRSSSFVCSPHASLAEALALA